MSIWSEQTTGSCAPAVSDKSTTIVRGEPLSSRRDTTEAEVYDTPAVPPAESIAPEGERERGHII